MLKRIAVTALLLCMLGLGVRALGLIYPARHVEKNEQSSTDDARQRKRVAKPGPKEIREKFSQMVRRISDPLITQGGETVTGLKIGDRNDGDAGAITVEIAAVHCLSCGCCEADVQDTKFYDEDLALVLDADNIGDLTVKRTRITDDGLRGLSRHENLTHLDLSQNDLTDAGLAHIGKLKKLKVLNLNYTSITGSGLQHLAALRDLEELCLNNTPLEDAALRHLSSLRNLRKLTLKNTPLTGEGFAEVDGLGNLEELDLSRAKCSDEGLSHLPELPGLKRIDLSATGAGNAALAAVSRSGNLEEINLARTRISDAGLARLSAMKHLRSLVLSDTDVTDAGFSHLAAVTTLEELQFSNTGVRGPGICHLGNCLQLKLLGGGYDPREGIEADDRTLSTLARFHQLRQLSIRVVGHSKPANVDFRDMKELWQLQITCSEPIDRIELSDMPKLNSLEIRSPGQPTPYWHGECETQEPTTRIGRITVSDVGGETRSPLSLSLVVPDELRLQGIGKIHRLWAWGNIQAEQAAELAALPLPYSVKLVCAVGTDPAAVGRILAGADEESAGDLEITVEDWDEAWSDAMRAVHSPFRHMTLQAGRIDGRVPVAIGGFANLEQLTLSGLTAESLILESVNPQARELRLENVSLRELRLVECSVPVAFRAVHRLDRLIVDGIPPGAKYVSIFADRGGPAGQVFAPTVLELHRIRDLLICSLRNGHGLERVEMYGEGGDFAEFQFVPNTVREMVWEGREPGRWQGEFEHHAR